MEIYVVESGLLTDEVGEGRVSEEGRRASVGLARSVFRPSV